MNQTNLSMVRGQTFSFDVTITNSGTGAPENLINAQELKFTAKWEFTDADGAAVFQKTIGTGVTVTDAPNGKLNVTIASGDTTGLPFIVVNLNYDLKYIDASGNVFVPISGILNISPNVTIS